MFFSWREPEKVNWKAGQCHSYTHDKSWTSNLTITWSNLKHTGTVWRPTVSLTWSQCAGQRCTAESNLNTLDTLNYIRIRALWLHVALWAASCLVLLVLHLCVWFHHRSLAAFREDSWFKSLFVRKVDPRKDAHSHLLAKKEDSNLYKIQCKCCLYVAVGVLVVLCAL